jgi:hypothetical protein
MKDEQAVAHAHSIFDPIAQEFLGRDDVDIGPMFGSEGLRIRGKVFAFIASGGELLVKVPEARADELVAAGTAAHMVMRERTMREWVVLDPGAPDQWSSLIGEAFHYLDEITPR